MLSGARVLVADDDPDLLDAVVEMLARAGAEVFQARDGAQLVDRMAEEGPFDLVVTDIAMPWMTGLRAMRAARLAGLGTSLIVMTALRDATIPADVKALGGILLLKPFDAAELEAAAEGLLAKRRAPAGRTKSPPSSPLRVLLVEDYSDLAEVMAEFLRAEGLDVTTALSGREALEAAAELQPQLLLCDLNLPDMSGLDVVRSLRSRPATEDVYAVILTAMRDTESAYRSQAEARGVNEFMSKPISLEAIRALTQKLATRPVNQ